MAGKRIRIKLEATDLQQQLLSVVDSESTRRGINEIVGEMANKYVPAESGALRESMHAGPKTVTWSTPYARYQYYGEVYGPNFPIESQGIIVGWFSRPGERKHPTGRELGIPGEWKGWTFGYTTPGTKHHWYNRMLDNDKRVLQIRITNFLKRKFREKYGR